MGYPVRHEHIAKNSLGITTRAFRGIFSKSFPKKKIEMEKKNVVQPFSREIQMYTAKDHISNTKRV